VGNGRERDRAIKWPRETKREINRDKVWELGNNELVREGR